MIETPTQIEVPKFKQRVRLIRPLYTDNGTDSMYFGVGAIAVVEEINIHEEQGVCIGIDFDKKQETEDLTKQIEAFIELNNGSPRYYFYDNCTGSINSMQIGGLLEFHMCCDFIE